VTGSPKARPIASAMSRVGAPSSATACRRDARRSLRESESDEARGIGPVHGGPPVGPVSRVARDVLFRGHCGDHRDEPVVAGSVDGRRKAQAHGVHTAVDELEREILAAAARLRAMERGRIVLPGRPALGESGDARGEQEGAVGLGHPVCEDQVEVRPVVVARLVALAGDATATARKAVPTAAAARMAVR